MAKKQKTSGSGKTVLDMAIEVLNSHRYDGSDNWDEHWGTLRSADIIHIARSLAGGLLTIERVDTIERAAEVYNQFEAYGATDWEAVRTLVAEVVQSETARKMVYKFEAVAVADRLIRDGKKGGDS